MIRLRSNCKHYNGQSSSGCLLHRKAIVFLTEIWLFYVILGVLGDDFTVIGHYTRMHKGDTALLCIGWSQSPLQHRINSEYSVCWIKANYILSTLNTLLKSHIYIRILYIFVTFPDTTIGHLGIFVLTKSREGKRARKA